MANLNSDHLSKKREEYLATAPSIKELLVDSTGDENYGNVPNGVAPETVEYDDSIDSRPVDNAGMNTATMGMRTTDIRAAQLKQMPQAEKDYYFVQGDVNVYDTEYEENYGVDDDDDYTDEYDDEYDDDEINDELDLLDEDDDDAEYMMIDDDGDIDEEEVGVDEEDEDIAEIVAMLQAMGIEDFGDDFDEDYADLDEEDLIMIASYQPRRKDIAVSPTVPATLPSRPTDSDSTAAVERKVRHSGEMNGTHQRSGKTYELLFR